MRPILRLMFLGSLLCGLASCSEKSECDDPKANFTFSWPYDTLSQGQKCTKVFLTQCRGVTVDGCKKGLTCFNDFCQAKECTASADCRTYGSNAVCQPYVIKDFDYGDHTADANFGKWCYKPPSGTNTSNCSQGCLDTCTVGADCIKICC